MEFTNQTPRPRGSDSTLTRILAADPDADTRGIIETACRLEGWEATTAADGTAVLAHLRTGRPHLIVTELTMPDIGGLALLARIRAERPDIPVMVLADGEGARHRIGCLAAGADDYVGKPFNLEEVMLRLKCLLRRGAAPPDPAATRLVVGDIELDEDTRDVRRRGIPLDLTDTEFRLLRYLMRNPRRVLSKPQILAQVWDCDDRVRPSVVELYISYLRRKLGHRTAPVIHTVRGVGYVLRPAADDRRLETAGRHPK